MRFSLVVIPTLNLSLFVILTLNGVKGKNLMVLRAGSEKGKNPVMLGTVSRDSLSSKFNWAPRMTLLNALRRLYVDSHGEATGYY